MNPQQEKKLNEVHAAIVGNEATGHKGIAKRVEELESYKKKAEGFENKVIGGSIVGSAVFSFLWSKLFG